MYNKIRLTIKSSPLLKRSIWTLLIVFLYMLGRNINVSTVAVNSGVAQDMQMQKYLESLVSVTGGSISQFNLFSLGLSPWMTSMILWRFLTVFKMVRVGTSKSAQLYQYYLALAIAFLQAYGLTASITFFPVPWFNFDSILVSRVITIIILVTGVFVMMWLGNLNTGKGIGGMMVFILINMILNFVRNIYLYFSSNNFEGSELLVQIALFVLILGLLVMTNVTLYRAEYRIKIRRVSLNGTYGSESYIPIRMTPAGGMPFMYGMTLMILPPIVIGLLLNLFPGNSTLLYLVTHLRLSQMPGIIAYMILLYVLSIGFAYYNYDAYEIAKGMRNNGDYINNIQPGKETQYYLQGKITQLANVGALYTMIIAGVPLLFVVGNSDSTSIALLVTNAFIISSLMLGVVEQVNTYRMWKQYQDLI